jgi:hypothetical protein
MVMSILYFWEPPKTAFRSWVDGDRSVLGVAGFMAGSFGWCLFDHSLCAADWFWVAWISNTMGVSASAAG